MLEVKFYDKVDDRLLKFAVIISRYKNKWVFCKHRDRDTYEVPGGHREEREEITETAKRELYEETGALSYDLHRICIYSVVKEEPDTVREASYGMLYYAEIKEFGELPDMEMELIDFFEKIPEKLTYPLIQPRLIEKVDLFLSKQTSLADNTQRG